ncbi:c-type cytochrome [Tundrisphaera sp. TA3]|uniref:c-type cytochrome n=1 Tax=Tundrisphaera sp. TA3 TaxID=3435775 RepID=UPI003EBD2ABE
MATRFRRFVPSTLLLLGLVGCDGFDAPGPIAYRDSERMTRELAGKPKLQAAIRKSLATLYGPDIRHLNVPQDSGLRDGGIYLANRVVTDGKAREATEFDPATGKSRPIEGGYTLFRRHCLHCHGVAGGGDGPTATFLAYPRPRDFRPGIFKFTSTSPAGAKPTRDDLRKTINEGLHGTSMPAFDALMTPSEVDQVIDYTIFLSMRGETEQFLVGEAALADDEDAENTVGVDVAAEVAATVASTWTQANEQVVNPSVKRGEAADASILRGRDLFLGTNTTGNKLECAGCHGANGEGNGPSFIEKPIFDDVVFRLKSLDEAIARRYRANLEASHAAAHAPKSDAAGVAKFFEENPALLAQMVKERELLPEVAAKDFPEYAKANGPKVIEAARKAQPLLDDPEFRTFLLAKYQLWTDGSLDAWGNPLRPANLVGVADRGVFYKGGRRPLDLYWRIAKGINGAKMPAHAGLLTDDQIWDVVNFVLAVPDRPELLRPAPAPEAAKASVAASR